MKKLMLFILLNLNFISQAPLRNCNNCKKGCNLNQTCCFLVNCPEDCNPYTCNPHCSNVSDPKCIFDPISGKYMCICA